jgi:hypothetical protein
MTPVRKLAPKSISFNVGNIPIADHIDSPPIPHPKVASTKHKYLALSPVSESPPMDGPSSPSQRFLAHSFGSQDSSNEGSVISQDDSGHLTTPRAVSKTGNLGPKAKLPRYGPTTVKSAENREGSTPWEWFQHINFPNFRLPETKWIPSWRLPYAKQIPAVVSAHKNQDHGNSTPAQAGKPHKKTAKFVSDQVTESLSKSQIFPATPKTSRRWSSTGIDDAIISSTEPDGSSNVERRKTISLDTSGSDALIAVKARLAQRSKSDASRRDCPTIITLRRASAILDTVAQRQTSVDFISLPQANTAEVTPPDWQQLQPHVPIITYLTSHDEIKGLFDVIRTSFADGTPLRTSPLTSPRKEKPDTGSAPKTPLKKHITFRQVSLQKSWFPDVAVTVADVHIFAKHSPPADRRGSFMSQISRKSSIITSMLARKSIHEIIWEEDGAPRSLISSTWSNGSNARDSIPYIWSTTSHNDSNDLRQKDLADTTSASSQISSTSPPLFMTVFEDNHKEPAASPLKPESECSSHFPGKLPDFEKAVPQFVPDDVVSFPPLPTRNSTSEWISPLPDMASPMATSLEVEVPEEALDLPTPTDQGRSLYSYGIDATSGFLRPEHPKTPSHQLVASPTLPSLFEESTLFKVTFTDRFEEPHRMGRRRSSNIIDAPVIRERAGKKATFGSSIGMSTKIRRRSSPRIDHIRIEHANVEIVEGRAPWKKPRKDSGYPSGALRSLVADTDEDEHMEEHTEEAEELEESFEPDAERSLRSSPGTTKPKSSSEILRKLEEKVIKETTRQKGRIQLLEERTPMLTVRDQVGIYAAMTGARKARSSRSDECTSECHAHNCREETSGQRNPSVD